MRISPGEKREKKHGRQREKRRMRKRLKRAEREETKMQAYIKLSFPLPRRGGRKIKGFGDGVGKGRGNKEKLVIQGSRMVSGTRCPAGSDPVKKWTESRAAAQKGCCPVRILAELLYIHSP